MSGRSRTGFTHIAYVLLALLQSNAAFAQTSAKNAARSAKEPLVAATPLSQSWIPNDVDQAIPAVVAGAGCSLPEVLTRAGQRVEELVENVGRFTATEVLVHQPVDRSGRMRRSTTVKFDYLVSIAAGRDGFLQVEEFRNRSLSLDNFPSHIATTGTPSLVLIFHPRYIGDFKTQCEGLGEWRGQPAWQVRFEQRRDRPGRICSFVVNGAAYQVNLRGRAWILADSFQVARLETDILESIPKIRLRRNHESIEYRAMGIPNSGIQLWLPSSAELYMDFKGKQFYRKHSFTDFKLFSVNMQYQVGEPKEAQLAQQPAQ